MDHDSQKWFRITCGFELSLLVLAVIIAKLTHRSLFADFKWDFEDALWGLCATAPALAVFVRSLRSGWKPLVQIRSALDRTVGHLFKEFSIAQLFVISALAGISEEVLFRAIIQGVLEGTLGRTGALLAASVLFGCAHLLTWSYGFISALAGLYLGGLWLATGNLLVPIVAHGLYDFLALVYFLRFSGRF